MRKVFCDCCGREIFEMQNIYSMEIKNGNDNEIVIEDMCDDCFQDINYIISNNRRVL